MRCHALILLLALARSVRGEDMPECAQDCLDGNGSLDCDLLDTCLGDCEFPLGEDLPDEQAAYDKLYTEFMCAAVEMAPAWCTCARSRAMTSLSLISHLLPPTRP